MKEHFKLTAFEKGAITLDFVISEKNPITKPTHLHFRWAEEKCPVCGSPLIMIYCPTDKHESGIGAALSEQNHKTVVSCVNCNLVLVTNNNKPL
jgi:hypothetical protein